VRTFPDPAGKWQISNDGGSEPLWRADGRELFYVRPDKRLIAVPIVLTDSVDRGAPRELFMAIPGLSTPYRTNYAVASDGQRFLVNAVVPGVSPPPITVFLNWTAALEK
jgi:hypothetical protein